MGVYRSKPETTKSTERDALPDFCSAAVSSQCGWRLSMEDAHVLKLAEDMCLFGVFDGHGGPTVSQYAAAKLHELARKHDISLRSTEEEYKCFIMELDTLVQSDIGECESEGTTLVVAFVYKLPDRLDGKIRYTIKVLNSGDSRAVLVRGPGRPYKDEEEILASEDHKPDNPTEKLRIEKSGNMVSANRVNGDLALSRALGDFRFKQSTKDLPPEKQAVTADPDVYTWDAVEGDFLFLACDGIFDVRTNEEIRKYVHGLDVSEGPSEGDALAQACENLMDECICPNPNEQLGGDNMTVAIVHLAPPRAIPEPVEPTEHPVSKPSEEDLTTTPPTSPELQKQPSAPELITESEQSAGLHPGLNNGG